MRKQLPPNYEHRLDMNELATFVDRHPQVLRKYYSLGLLPEPKHSIQHAKKTTRRFTVAEAEQIKHKLDNMKWGALADARKVKNKKRRRR